MNVLVANIPKIYHAADLRNFFSEMIESESFECFHYKHRPMLSTDGSNTNMFCCVITIKCERINEFIMKYHNKYWITNDGLNMNIKCFIKPIKVDASDEHSDVRDDKQLNDSHFKHELLRQWKSKHKKRDLNIDLSQSSSISSNDLRSLRELHPPKDVLPFGNIGTPNRVFLQMIRECRFPTQLINKLNLQFPRSYRKRIYSNVPFDYRTSKIKSQPKDYDLIVKAKDGTIINDIFARKKPNKSIDETETMKKNDDDDDDDESDGAEEWDRDEALHGDNDQERNRERLFEDDIELQWEKGGSGLVFYTDAQYWDHRDGDFDEKTANDWDVDMGLYEGSSADKDAHDLRDIRIERKRFNTTLSDDSDDERTDSNKIGAFEKYTKGIGKRILEKHGWRCGSGMGKSIIGLSEPLLNNGQNPMDKSGFGYRGPKLERFWVRKKKKVKRLTN